MFLDRYRFLKFFNTGICTVTYAKYLLIVFEKLTDNFWHGTFLLKAKLCVLGTQKWAPKILIENDCRGDWKRKIQVVVKHNAWTVGLASCWKVVMEVKITLHQRYIVGDLLRENTIDLVHHKHIYFWCKLYLPFKV